MPMTYTLTPGQPPAAALLSTFLLLLSVGRYISHDVFSLPDFPYLSIVIFSLRPGSGVTLVSIVWYGTTRTSHPRVV